MFGIVGESEKRGEKSFCTSYAGKKSDVKSAQTVEGIERVKETRKDHLYPFIII